MIWLTNSSTRSLNAPLIATELLCLRLYSSFLRVSQENGSIWESTPQDVPNRKAICGEVFTTARTIPHDGLLLKIHPLPVFQSRPGLSSYWAFSAILCVDHTVVEDLFVEWGGHDSRQPNPGWKFDDIFPVPQQTVSVGFFAYPMDQTGRKIFQVSMSHSSIFQTRKSSFGLISPLILFTSSDTRLPSMIVVSH